MTCSWHAVDQGKARKRFKASNFLSSNINLQSDSSSFIPTHKPDVYLSLRTGMKAREKEQEKERKTAKQDYRGYFNYFIFLLTFMTLFVDQTDIQDLHFIF